MIIRWLFGKFGEILAPFYSSTETKNSTTTSTEAPEQKNEEEDITEVRDEEAQEEVTRKVSFAQNHHERREMGEPMVMVHHSNKNSSEAEDTVSLQEEMDSSKSHTQNENAQLKEIKEHLTELARKLKSWIHDILPAGRYNGGGSGADVFSDNFLPTTTSTALASTSASNNGNGGGATATNRPYRLRIDEWDRREWVALRGEFGTDVDHWDDGDGSD